MSNIRISELSEELALDSGDVVPVVHGGHTKKTTLQAIYTFVADAVKPVVINDVWMGITAAVHELAQFVGSGVFSTTAQNATDAINELDGEVTSLSERVSASVGLPRGNSISANGDLNDYTTLGSYYSANAATSSSLGNCPYVAGSFKLLVVEASGTSRTQILFPVYSTVATSIFFRTFRNNAWDPWLKVNATAV